MKYAALIAALVAGVMLGGCFSSVISSYEVPKDITSRQCTVAADCVDNGGGGGS
jgi:hypothetical protein